jgi:hypothetical protein
MVSPAGSLGLDGAEHGSQPPAQTMPLARWPHADAWAMVWRAEEFNPSSFQRPLQSIEGTGVARWHAVDQFQAPNGGDADSRDGRELCGTPA